MQAQDLQVNRAQRPTLATGLDRPKRRALQLQDVDTLDLIKLIKVLLWETLSPRYVWFPDGSIIVREPAMFIMA